MTNQKRLRASVVALACAWAATAAWSQSPLRAWNTHPEGYPVTEALKSFAQDVESTTRGKYRIQVHSNAVLGDQVKAIAMLKSGEIELAEFSAAQLSDFAPGLKAFNLPFLFVDSAHMFRYLDGALGAKLAEQLKASGFVVLGWYNGGARSFYCAGKSPAKAENLAGLRIRVPQSEVYTSMVKLLGATPVEIPYKEVLDGFQQGKIDCAEGSLASFEATGHYKVARHVLLDNHIVSPELLVASTKLWNTLNDTEKAQFKDAGNRSALLMRDLWEKRVTAARAAVTKDGVQIVPVKDISPYVRKMAPLYGKYMADPAVRADLFMIVGNQ